MTMKISIPKEQLSTLAKVTFQGNIHVIDDIQGVNKAISKLQEYKILGFDTETRPSFKKGVVHSVALMQISTEQDCYLFRINKIGMPDALKSFLENPSVTKVGLSLKDDFGMIHKVSEANMSGFIDLQKIVPDYGIADASLQKIYAILFDKRISKGQRLTNWEADNLTEAQKEYAAIDAWACLKIYNHLSAHLFDPQKSKYIVNEEN